MDDVLVSIIVPVYNAEKYVPICVESILNQTLKNFELIIVDDGSTDKSYEICNSYAEKDHRIKLLRAQNGGPARARNIGVKNANGKYVEFVDADDMLFPNALTQLATIARNEEPELIIASAQILNSDNSINRNISFDVNFSIQIGEALANMEIPEKEKYLHYIWNKWYLRSLIERKQVLFDENLYLGEDFVFNCDYFAEVKSIRITNVMLYGYYRRDNGSLSSQFNMDELQRRKKVDGKYLQLLKRKKVYAKNPIKYDVQIGEVCLNSIMGIGQANQMISFEEKITYVKGFLDSEYSTFLNRLNIEMKTLSIRKLVLILLNSNNLIGVIAVLHIYYLIKDKIRRHHAE